MKAGENKSLIEQQCIQCGTEWRIPTLSLADWNALAEMFQSSNYVGFREKLSQTNGITQYDAKSVQLHFCRVTDECNSCNSKLSEKGGVVCPSCGALNYNF